MAKFLYLPIEIAARELDARLLVALFAVKSGMEVLVGQKWLLQQNAAALPPGAFLFKTMSPSDSSNMLKASRHGHRIFAIDEEMPGLGEGCGELKWVQEQAVDICDAVFLPGVAHLEAMQKRFPVHQMKFYSTGNPRWDLLRAELRGLYKKEADSLRRRYGPYVLVNTNVGLMNSAKGSPDKLIRNLTKDGRLDFSQEKDRNWAEEAKSFQAASLDASISFVKKFSKAEPNRTILVRPHPTENLSTYRDAFGNNPRVTVVFEGPAAPWIMAADILVHTACTTANEAFALGVPAVCINTGRSIFYEYFVSQKVSLEAEGVEQAVQLVKETLHNSGATALSQKQKMKTTFDRFFAAGTGKFAAERMTEIMLDATQFVPLSSAIQKRKKFKTWRFRTRFQKLIFPDLSAQYLEDKLLEMTKQLKFDTTPKVGKFAQALYHISSRDKLVSNMNLPVYQEWLGGLF